MVEYPASLPLDAVMLLTDIVRSRSLATRKVEAAKAAWNIQGFAQKSFLGDNVVGADTPENVEFAGEFAKLVMALDDLEDEGVRFGAENEEEAGSIAVVVSIVGIVIQIIQLLKNRNPKSDNEVGCDGGDCDCPTETQE